MPGLSPALYTGRVWHKRSQTKKHAFSYPVFYLLVDLDSFRSGCSDSRLLSFERNNFLSFWQKDYGEQDSSCLKEQLLRACGHLHLKDRVDRIFMLSMPRIFGFAFNPLTVYYCLGPDRELRALFYEVHNTFGEKITYGCGVNYDHSSQRVDTHSVDKALHVSPFFNMEGSYRFHQKITPDMLSLGIHYHLAGKSRLTAHLKVKKQKLTGRNLAGALISIPFVTLKTVVAIHVQALVLWIKGISVHKKPDAPGHRYALANKKSRKGQEA